MTTGSTCPNCASVSLNRQTIFNLRTCLNCATRLVLRAWPNRAAAQAMAAVVECAGREYSMDDLRASVRAALKTKQQEALS